MAGGFLGRPTIDKTQSTMKDYSRRRAPRNAITHSAGTGWCDTKPGFASCMTRHAVA